ncbi:MAG: hypothetical protein RLO50_13630 [Azospirillaceae bacterium]
MHNLALCENSFSNYAMDRGGLSTSTADRPGAPCLNRLASGAARPFEAPALPAVGRGDERICIFNKLFVIPANAGIQWTVQAAPTNWISAFAEMTFEPGV